MVELDTLSYWKRFEATGNIADYLEYVKHIQSGFEYEEYDEDFCGWTGDMGEEDGRSG